MTREIITPQTDPDHAVVGRLFVANRGEIYYCDSYDPRQGFWMTQVNGTRRANVSERAIDRTYHTIHFINYEDGTVHAFSAWGSPFEKKMKGKA